MLRYLIDLLRELQYQNYSSRTVDIYIRCVEIFLKRYNKDPPISIQDKDVIDFTLYLQSKNKAPKTVNLYKDVIKYFVLHILKKSDFLIIKISKEAKKLLVVLSLYEVKNILEFVSNPKHQLLLSLSYGAGLRVSEIVSLKIGDVDVHRGIIHIKGAKGQKDRISVFPKNCSELYQVIIAGKQSNDYVII